MITVNTAKFHAAVAAASKLVGTKATMPVLSTVLISAQQNKLSVCSTNLDLSYVETIPCVTDSLEVEAICLAGRRLATVLGAVDGADSRLTVGKKLTAKLACGSSNFNLLGIGREEFPPLPEATGEMCKLPAEELAGLFDAVAPAMSSDETRYTLNGVYVSATPDGLVFVATDGRRLHLRSSTQKLPEGTKAIIPAKTVNMLSGLIRAEKAKEIAVWFAAKLVTFRILREDGEVVLQSKLVDGNYPNYRQVIPKQGGVIVEADQETLLAAVHRVALVTSEKSNSVKVAVHGQVMTLSAASPDLGSAQEEIAVKAPEETSKMLALNPSFFLSAIESVGRANVQMDITDEVSPLLVQDERFTAVIMPVRLS